jgi:hypothetical protein
VSEAEQKFFPTTITVNRTTKKSSQDDQDGEPETIEVHKFATNPAIVSISYPVKLTRAYQTAGITVGVSVPCYAEEIPAAFEKANSLVIERLKVEIPKVKALLAKMAEESR